MQDHRAADTPRVSAVTYPHPHWRYLLLFQSRRQLESWLVTVLLASSAVYLSVTLFHQPFAPLATILSAVVGASLCSVLMVLPAELTVSAAAPDTVPLLYARLDAMRYVEGSRFGKNIVFRQDLPRFLRWDEADLTMRTEPGTVTFTGPVFMLKVIRSSLLRNLARANGAAKRDGLRR
ncbi:MAG TPA: hypothetical protein VFS95_00490 [Telluria sp.]|nr:hypothetical protein [Telluria sp.]